MIRKLFIAFYIILSLFIACSFAGEQITSFDDSALPVLNEELRKISDGINKPRNLAGPAVYGTLPTSKGGTGSSANANAANGVVILNSSAQLPAVSGALLTNLPVSDTNTSNVVFTYTGSWSREPASYATIISTKFKKIAGISTVTVYGLIQSGNNSFTVYMKPDIGGVNGEVGTSSSSPVWVSTALDVSGLSNGTVYNVIIQIQGIGSGYTITATSFIGIGS